MPENDPTPTDAASKPDEQPDLPQSEGGAAMEAGPAFQASQGHGLPAGEDTPRAELDEARDRALRCQAELENYRKRVARQMEEERRYANLPLMRDLLHVWDDMGRAIDAAGQGSQNDGMLEGFKMVVRQMEDVLARYHCTRIEAVGKPFDPHFHEAILQQPSAEHPPGTVTLETRAGFQLHDRVVRPSQVIVSAAVEGHNEAEPSEVDEE